MLCPQNFVGLANFRSQVENILTSQVFVDPNGEISRYYQMWGDSTPPSVTHCIPFSSSFCLQPLWSPLSSFPTIGHDVPLWFDDYDDFLRTYPDSIKRAKIIEYQCNQVVSHLQSREFDTVMLIAQDPLRSVSAPAQVQLSSPWGLHGSYYNCTPTYYVRLIIALLLKAGKNVYITDFNKLYVEGNGVARSQSCRYIAKHFSGMSTILSCEWNLLNNNSNAIAIQLGIMQGISSVNSAIKSIIGPSLRVWKHPNARGTGYQYWINMLLNL